MGTYMVTHKMRLIGQEVRNVYYYVTSVGEPSNAEWQDIVDEVRADYASELQAFQSDMWTFYAIDRRRVDTPGLLSFVEIPTSGDLDGSLAADPIATQVACLASLKGTTTKPNRARTYKCGGCENYMTDGLWATGYLDAVQAFEELQSNLNSGGTNPLSRVAAQWNTSHTQVVATNDLSGAAVLMSAVPATQRRRRIGVGI